MEESLPMSKEVPKKEPFVAPGGRHSVYEEAAMPYTSENAGGYAGSSQVEMVRERNERVLMAIDGVVGIVVGRTPIGDDAIILYLRDASVKQRVPPQVEGYPIETIVTGEIDAYSGPGR
jgi:hypothetical protein